jgi:hypothetical protein
MYCSVYSSRFDLFSGGFSTPLIPETIHVPTKNQILRLSFKLRHRIRYLRRILQSSRMVPLYASRCDNRSLPGTTMCIMARSALPQSLAICLFFFLEAWRDPFLGDNGCVLGSSWKHVFALDILVARRSIRQVRIFFLPPLLSLRLIVMHAAPQRNQAGEDLSNVLSSLSIQGALCLFWI